MSGFKIITFDVEHGSCHFLRTPNDLGIMVDAGNNADFSPAIHLNKAWGMNNLKWLTLTHHDSDHLTDIENVDNYIHPNIIFRPILTREQLLNFYPDGLSDYQEYFLKFEDKYKLSVPPIEDPSYDWGGIQFATFRNLIDDFDNPNINDLSIVTFALYKGWTFIFPGDLTNVGWLKLMEKEEFQNWLGRVDVLVASHHGRDSGYCSEAFELCKPYLTIISDKGSCETSVTDKYTNISKGLEVRNSQGETNKRYVVTTRSDGAIHIDIDEEGRYTIKTSV